MIILFAFSLYMIFGGAAKRYEKLESETSPEFLRKNQASLLTWEASRAFPDMSSELRRRTEMSSVGGRWSHARGTIRSLNNSGSKWLAFTLNVRGGKGRIDLQTSSSSFSLQYADRLGTFKAEGALFGHINIDGEMLDLHQTPIGRIHYRQAFTPMGSSYITTVDIGGRTIAEVHYLSDFGDRLWKAPALVQEMASDMSRDETLWIMAVIAMSLYSHCKTSRLM
jgi:hypothetical protein